MRDESWYHAEARRLARVSELLEEREEGPELGKLLGQIRLLQELQGLPVISREKLVQQGFKALQKMFEELKAAMPKKDESWYQAEARERALRDQASELSAARQEGFAEGFMEKGWLIGHEKGREEGREKGREEGLEKGNLIGQIQILQELQGLPVTSKEELIQLDSTALQNMLQELKATFRPEW